MSELDEFRVGVCYGRGLACTLACAAACWLIKGGRLSIADYQTQLERERCEVYLETWARSAVSSKEWQAALKQVRRHSSDQLAGYILPVLEPAGRWLN